MTRRVLKLAVGAFVALALGGGVFVGSAAAAYPPTVFPPPPAPPRNDLFVNAAVLSPTPTVFPISPVAGVIRYATNENLAGEPHHIGGSGGAHQSVWYRWTAPRSGLVEFNTCNSRFDTELGVYTGNAVNALTPVAQNDDAAVSCGSTFPLNFNSRVQFPATAGTTYRIAVDGFAARGFDNTGAFFLNYNYLPV